MHVWEWKCRKSLIRMYACMHVCADVDRLGVPQGSVFIDRKGACMGYACTWEWKCSRKTKFHAMVARFSGLYVAFNNNLSFGIFDLVSFTLTLSVFISSRSRSGVFSISSRESPAAALNFCCHLNHLKGRSDGNCDSSLSWIMYYLQHRNCKRATPVPISSTRHKRINATRRY